ncbi:MAG: sugar kinase [Bacteroidetes bacterium]|nr:MAG: sugar kinase [Bacteroidota bacterium]
MSCADLSEVLGKSVPLVAKALNELVKSGHIVEKGFAPSSGGRRPLVYSLKPNDMFIVAVGMDQLFTKITIVDLLKNPILPIETHELKLHNNNDALPGLIRIIENAIERSGVDSTKIIGVGIGMPGFVNTTLGINYSYLSTNSKESLSDYLERSLQMPVYIDNDSSMIALAELKFGLARQVENVMVMNIGWGIGLGMIIHGELFRGHTGYAGEFSHMPIFDTDILCECGKRGCLETEASLLVVAKKAMEEIKHGKVSRMEAKDSYEEMCTSVMIAANKGDQTAIELLSDMGYKIGKGLAILIHLVNPELIVLSGRGADVGKILMAPIQQALNKYSIPRLAENTELKVSGLGHDAELIGAAALVMENFGEKVYQPAT